jgi:hypothetical protein
MTLPRSGMSETECTDPVLHVGLSPCVDWSVMRDLDLLPRITPKPSERVATACLYHGKMVRPERFERPALRFVV